MTNTDKNDFNATIGNTVLSTAFFQKKDEKQVIFYNGENKHEVIDFFKKRCFGKFLKVKEDDTLHYQKNTYDNRTLITPNKYIFFNYDEDDWWYICQLTEDEFNKLFISIKL